MSTPNTKEDSNAASTGKPPDSTAPAGGHSRVVDEQVKLLFRNAPAAVGTTVVISLIAYGFVANAGLPYAGMWLVWSLLVSAWRGQMAWQYRREGPDVSDPARWMTLFQLGVFAAGLTWGLLGAFFFTPAPSEVKIAIVMVLAGMAAGAIGVYAVEKRVYAAFAMPMLLPLAITLLAQEQRVYHLVAGMAVIFIAVSLVFVHNTSRTLMDAILLKFAHEETLVKLRDEIRRRSELSAQQLVRESHMRMLSDNVPACIAHFDREEVLRYSNKGYAALFDREQESILGVHARDVLGAERYAEQRHFAERAVAGEAQQYEQILQRAGAETAVLDVICAPYRTQTGGTDGYYIFAVDTTEHQRLQQRLRSGEAQARMVIQSLELSGEAIFSKALDGVVTSWNQGAERIYGYSADEAIGKSMRELHLVHLSDRDFEKILRRIQSGVPTASEEQRTRKDGTTIFVLISTSPIFDVDGTLMGEMTVARDITQMRLAQLELAKAERELRLLLDNTPAMICYVDRSLRYRLANKAYADQYGMDAAKLIGLSFRDVLDTALLPRVEQHLQQALQGKPVRYESTRVSATGEARDLVVNYVPDFGGDGEVVGVFTLLSDVTELKQIDRMKSEFVSTVSHELRTPLTSIRGSLDLLAGGIAGKLPDEAQDLLGIAQKNCERLVQLINDILEIEKIESRNLPLDCARVDLVSLVEEAVAHNAGYATDRRVRIQIVESVSSAMVEVDARRLSQVMANLLSNAAKYSPESGLVEVSVRRIEGSFRVLVADRGPGVAPAFRARMFQRFSQGDSSDTRKVGGTGLGLAIAKSIIERFGGSIGFDSTPGQGATFFFDLPWATRTFARPAGEFAVERRLPTTGKILVCEDDPEEAALIGRILREGGFELVTAVSAADAKMYLGRTRFDAMTLDLRLPDKNGLDLLAEIRQSAATQALPVIVVSGSLRRSGEFAGSALEVADWLTKPIDDQRLLAAIRLHGTHATKPAILHVEDDPDVRRVVRALVSETAKYHEAASVAEARACLAGQRFDVVLLDVALGDGVGVDLLPQIEALSPTPAVVLFSASEPSADVAARVSASLVKSQVDNAELLAIVRGVIK